MKNVAGETYRWHAPPLRVRLGRSDAYTYWNGWARPSFPFRRQVGARAYPYAHFQVQGQGLNESVRQKQKQRQKQRQNLTLTMDLAYELGRIDS
jgi:hypothetical protein